MSRTLVNTVYVSGLVATAATTAARSALGWYLNKSKITILIIKSGMVLSLKLVSPHGKLNF